MASPLRKVSSTFMVTCTDLPRHPTYGDTSYLQADGSGLTGKGSSQFDGPFTTLLTHTLLGFLVWHQPGRERPLSSEGDSVPALREGPSLRIDTAGLPPLWNRSAKCTTNTRDESVEWLTFCANRVWVDTNLG